MSHKCADCSCWVAKKRVVGKTWITQRDWKEYRCVIDTEFLCDKCWKQYKGLLDETRKVYS